jgi:hypothetical protein
LPVLLDQSEHTRLPRIQDARLHDTGPLAEPERIALWRHYRDDHVIAPAAKEWQPQRSILRDGVIETLVQQTITDPDDWFTRVPTYLRRGTEPATPVLMAAEVARAIYSSPLAIDVAPHTQSHATTARRRGRRHREEGARPAGRTHSASGISTPGKSPF